MSFLGGACLAHECMSTQITYRAWGLSARRALNAARKEAERLEHLLSRFDPGSEVSRLNRSSGADWVSLSPETLSVLSLAENIRVLSGGAFDIRVGSLCDLWDFRNAAQPPDDVQVQRALPSVGSLQLDLDRGMARLTALGMTIDLGGIAKGYAADRIIGVIREQHVKSAFTNIGGNVSVLGRRPDGQPWAVGIRHPREAGRLLGAIQAQDCSVVTSGDYERCFAAPDGRRYHHLLNTATGRPVDSGLISVTVTAGNSALADALSTAVFVLGLEKGMMLLRKFEGTNALLVDSNLMVYVSEHLAGNYSPAGNGTYTVVRLEKEEKNGDEKGENQDVDTDCAWRACPWAGHWISGDGARPPRGDESHVCRP